MRILNYTKLALVASFVSTVGATAAMAQDVSGDRWWHRWWGGGSSHGGHGSTYNSVPEIDAGAGLLAVAAVLAALALTFELRRRRKTKLD